MISEENGDKLLKYLKSNDTSVAKSVALKVKFNMVFFLFNVLILNIEKIG